MLSIEVELVVMGSKVGVTPSESSHPPTLKIEVPEESRLLTDQLLTWA